MNQQLTLNIESETTPEDIQEMIQRTNEEELDSSPSVMPPPDIVAFRTGMREGLHSLSFSEGRCSPTCRSC